MLACDGRVVRENLVVTDKLCKIVLINSNVCYALAGETGTLEAVDRNIEWGSSFLKDAKAVAGHIAGFCTARGLSDAGFLVADSKQVFQVGFEEARWKLTEGEVFATGLGGLMIQEWLCMEYKRRCMDRKSAYEMALLCDEGLDLASRLTPVSGGLKCFTKITSEEVHTAGDAVRFMD